MSGFGWNYPPGVTGNEYAITGPDYEREVDGKCGNGHKAIVELAHGGHSWLACDECNWQTEVPDERPE